jgi:hypothetical protein
MISVVAVVEKYRRTLLRHAGLRWIEGDTDGQILHRPEFGANGATPLDVVTHRPRPQARYHLAYQTCRSPMAKVSVVTMGMIAPVGVALGSGRNPGNCQGPRAGLQMSVGFTVDSFPFG